ncbi:efflux RND transporter periplasmic adaptor subunit [Methylobacillus arboreus]|uniref:efflux RND transporter periplasmic adaptor subunit n=1 Tax=Methylobacillus arboreus TaxID=755170 RepID=UPI001E616FCA|nr:efflux RND transporter periplasmic adaptor subunit [Methylobacillus arboreus]MCB5191538.1 efflux RND transporter periplasmic adaptor subunit [Methylobacillus arboreus]
MLGAISLALGCSQTSAPEKAKERMEVAVFTVSKTSQVISTDLPGRTTAYLVSEIRPQVGGIIKQRAFVEGAVVKAGDLLYQIEPAPFQAVYDSAAASVQKAEANLVSVRLKAERYAELAKINAVSRQDNDDNQALFKQAEADLALAKAALDTARINLGFTRITAPISGLTAASAVTPGALVTANQETALTRVQQLDPIYVDVVQPSSELLRLKHELAQGNIKRINNMETPIRVVLENGQHYPHPGRLKVHGVSVNPTTGAVTLRAVVPNPDGLLMPGMYVHALLDEGVDEDAILVPQRGVSRNTRGEATVLVVDGNDQVQIKTIALSRTVGQNWLVNEGLAEGERVIVDGLQKVRVGDSVRPVPWQDTVSAPVASGGK